jgi:hypothetical protein
MSVESIRRRLEQLAAAALAADRGDPVCVWVNEGESAEKAMARRLAERPGQDPVRDGQKVFFVRWASAADTPKPGVRGKEKAPRNGGAEVGVDSNEGQTGLRPVP